MTTFAQALAAQENTEQFVTAGTYTGQSGVFNSNPSPGQFGGRLYIVAQGFVPPSNLLDPTTGTWPVIVTSYGTSASQRMFIQPGSSSVVFVGFWFQGVVDVEGDDISFWYCRGNFPLDRSTIATWSNPLYNAPRVWQVWGSTRVRILGCWSHDSGTPIDFSQSGKSATSPEVAGHIHQRGYPTPSNKFHCDTGADNYGPTDLGKIHDCLFLPNGDFGDTTGKAMGYETGGLHFECHGGNETWQVSNIWMFHASGNGIEVFGAAPGTQGPGGHLDMTFDTNVHVWDSHGDDVTLAANRGNATLHGTNAGAPATINFGVNDPAAAWHRAHPFSTYKQYFGDAGAPLPLPMSRYIIVSPGALGNTWTTNQYVQDLTTDLASYGGGARLDFRGSQFPSWTPALTQAQAFNLFDTRYGAEFGYIFNSQNASTPGIIIATLSDMPANFGNASNEYPPRGTETAVQAYVADVCDWLKARAPQGWECWIEWLNEPNYPGSMHLHSSGQADVDEYGYWIQQVSPTIRAHSCKVLAAAPAAQPSVRLSGDTWTSVYAGWPTVGGTRTYGQLDWKNFAAPYEAGFVDGQAWHAYFSGGSPFDNSVTGGARGATWPAMPAHFPNQYIFQHVRDAKEAYVLLYTAGNPKTKSRLIFTECGAVAAPPTMFTGVGSWNSSTRIWTRAPRSDGGGSWGGVQGSDVGEEPEVAHYVEEIIKLMQAGAVDGDGVDISSFLYAVCVYQHQDTPNESSAFGIRRGDNTVKGVDAAYGSKAYSFLGALQTQAQASITRTLNVDTTQKPGKISTVVPVAGDATVGILWTAAPVGSSATDHYRVTLTPATASSPLVLGVALGTVFNDVVNGTTYTVTVAASNDGGATYGPESDPVTFTPQATVVAPTRRHRVGVLRAGA